MDFKNELQSVIGLVPSIWAISMRYVILQILLILLVNLVLSENGASKLAFGHDIIN